VYIFAGFGIDSIRIGRFIRLYDGDFVNVHILAVNGMDGPGRRVEELQLTDQDVGTAIQIDEPGAGYFQGTAGRIVWFPFRDARIFSQGFRLLMGSPPFFALPFDGSPSGYGDVLQVMAGEQRGINF
jgi:hypothetical protein